MYELDCKKCKKVITSDSPSILEDGGCPSCKFIAMKKKAKADRKWGSKYGT